MRTYRRRVDQRELNRRRDLTAGPPECGSAGTASSPHGLSQMLRRRSKIAKVDLPSHAFRRSIAMRWLRSGASETLLMSVTGWSNSSMIKRYTATVAGEEAITAQRALLEAERTAARRQEHLRAVSSASRRQGRDRRHLQRCSTVGGHPRVVALVRVRPSAGRQRTDRSSSNDAAGLGSSALGDDHATHPTTHQRPTRRSCSKSRGTSKRTTSRHRRSSSIAAMVTVFRSPRPTTIVVTVRSTSTRSRPNHESTQQPNKSMMPDQATPS